MVAYPFCLSDSECFLSKYHLDPGYILSVGFLGERKNSIGLLQAFLDVYKSIRRKLVLIGGNRFLNAKNAEMVTNLINQNEDKIIHIPFLPSGSDMIKSAYSHCVFHVLPSHVETPGISNLEAMAFGKNILVGDCLPVREYFSDYAFYCQSSSRESVKKCA